MKKIKWALYLSITVSFCLAVFSLYQILIKNTQGRMLWVYVGILFVSIYNANTGAKTLGKIYGSRY